MNSDPAPDLLQAFEQVLEALRRTADALSSTLELMERGERLSDEGIADYRAQLATVERDRLRLHELLGGLWTMVERH